MSFKRKLCRHCKGKLEQERPSQEVHLECAADWVASQNAKKERAKAKEVRKADKDRKEKLKSRAEWAKEAQAAFNRFIRLRDRNDGCISCNKPSSWDGQWHASHFRSVGAASSVRFNEYNVHKACSVCNNHLSGNIAAYRPRLIEKIGIEKVLMLESHNQITRYSIEYLKRVKAIYTKRANRLERRYGDLRN